MAYADELARVDIHWVPQSAWSGEIAICGFWVHHHHFTGNDFDWSRDLQSLADGVAGKLVSHWSDLAGEFGQNCRIDLVRAAHIGSNGQELDAKMSALGSTDCVGAGSSLMPPEVALCVSFYGYVPGTFTTHAGRKRGRMYLPYLNTAMAGSNGKLANAQTVTDRWTAFFNDIQGMHTGHPIPPGNSDDYWELATVSGIDATWAQVERIVIDDHFDSQRRRQHQSDPTQYLGTINHN